MIVGILKRTEQATQNAAGQTKPSQCKAIRLAMDISKLVARFSI
jgi:hypothetical protein